VQPVAEGTDSPVVGVLAVGTRQPAQKGVDAFGRQFTAIDKRIQQALVELVGAWGDALPS